MIYLSGSNRGSCRLAAGVALSAGTGMWNGHAERWLSIGNDTQDDSGTCLGLHRTPLSKTLRPFDTIEA